MSQRLSLLKREGRRMAPRKPKFVGDAVVRGRLDGNVLGSARIEQMGGKLIAHIDASGMTAEDLRRGFSLGEVIPPEKCPDNLPTIPGLELPVEEDPKS